MNTFEAVTVANWEERTQKIQDIEAQNSKSLSGVWFRGLPDARLSLATTLERRRKQPFYVDEYFDLLTQTLPEVENFTGTRWKVPEWLDPKHRVANEFITSPAFGYMAHVRHHGFPSPLLDWSRSPYIAAYFAFRESFSSEETHVAIFAYSETPENGKSTSSSKPLIVSHGGFGLRTHFRHFRQQSCYTVCIERDPDGRWKFVPHERVFDAGSEDQDRLYKIQIPSTERMRVLRLFDRFNLNDLSLFGSEESLMETLAFQMIDKRFADRAARQAGNAEKKSVDR